MHTHRSRDHVTGCGSPTSHHMRPACQRHCERWDPRSTATHEFGKPTALRGKRSANAPRHQPAPVQPRPPVFPVITSVPPAAEPQRSHEWERALHFLTSARMPIPRVSDLNETSSFEPSLSATNIQSSGQTPRESPCDLYGWAVHRTHKGPGLPWLLCSAMLS